MEREDNFRLKRFKELKIKHGGGKQKDVVCSICKSEIEKKSICDVCNKCAELRKQNILICPMCEKGDKIEEPPKKKISTEKSREKVAQKKVSLIGFKQDKMKNEDSVDNSVGDVLKLLCPNCQKLLEHQIQSQQQQITDQRECSCEEIWESEHKEISNSARKIDSLERVCSCEKLKDMIQNQNNKSICSEHKVIENYCKCFKSAEPKEMNMDDLCKIIGREKISVLKEMYLLKEQSEDDILIKLKDVFENVSCDCGKSAQDNHISDNVCTTCLNNKPENISKDICPICGKDLKTEKATIEKQCPCNHSFTCIASDYRKKSNESLYSSCMNEKLESKFCSFSDPALTLNRKTCTQCQKEGIKLASDKKSENNKDPGAVCSCSKSKNVKSTSRNTSNISKEADNTVSSNWKIKNDDSKDVKIQFSKNALNDSFNSTTELNNQKKDDLLKLTCHIDEILNLTSKYKFSDSVEKFVDECKNAKCKINNNLSPKEKISKSNVKDLKVKDMETSNSSDLHDVGVFLTKFQEVVTVKIYQNDDGTINEERQIITIKTKTTNPSNVAVPDNFKNNKQTCLTSATSDMKQKGSTSSTQSGKVLKIIEPDESVKQKPSLTSSTMSKDASITSYVSCHIISSEGDLESKVFIDLNECSSMGAQTEDKNKCSKCRNKSNVKDAGRSISETCSIDTRTSDEYCASQKNKSVPSKSCCAIKIVPKHKENSNIDRELANNCLELLKRMLLEADQSTPSCQLKKSDSTAYSCNSKKSFKTSTPNITDELEKPIQNKEKEKSKSCCKKEVEIPKEKTNASSTTTCKCKAHPTQQSSRVSYPTFDSESKNISCNTSNTSNQIKFCVSISSKESSSNCIKKEEKQTKQECVFKKTKETSSSRDSEKTCCYQNKGLKQNNTSKTEYSSREKSLACPSCSSKSDAKKNKSHSRSGSAITSKSSCFCIPKTNDIIKESCCNESNSESCLKEKRLVCPTCGIKSQSKSSKKSTKKCDNSDDIHQACRVWTPLPKPCCKQSNECCHKKKSSNCSICSHKPLPKESSCYCKSKYKSDSQENKRCSTCGFRSSKESTCSKQPEPKKECCMSSLSSKSCCKQSQIEYKGKLSTCKSVNKPDTSKKKSCISCGSPVTPESSSCSYAGRSKEPNEKYWSETNSINQECCASTASLASCCNQTENQCCPKEKSSGCPSCSSKPRLKTPSCSCQNNNISNIKESKTCCKESENECCPKKNANSKTQSNDPSCSCTEISNEQSQECCRYPHNNSKQESCSSTPVSFKSCCGKPASACTFCSSKSEPKEMEEARTCLFCNSMIASKSSGTCVEKAKKYFKQPEPPKQRCCRSQTETTVKPSYQNDKAPQQKSCTCSKKANQDRRGNCPTCSATPSQEPKCFCKKKVEVPEKKCTCSTSKPNLDKSKSVTIIKPDPTIDAKSANVGLKIEDLDQNQCPVCAAKDKPKCNCKPKSETIIRQQKSDSNSCNKPCCVSAIESKSMEKVCLKSGSQSRKNITERPVECEKSCCSGPSVKDIKKCAGERSKSSVHVAVSKESCSLCEPRTKDVGTSTRRSDKYDVRNLEMIKLPEPTKKKVCSCFSESYIALDDWTSQIPARASSYHGRCYH